MPERIFARYLKPGETLFTEGEAGDDAYIVERGKIEILIDAPSGKKVVAELGKGEISRRDVADCGYATFGDGDCIAGCRTSGFDAGPAFQTDRSYRSYHAVDDPDNR